MVVQEHPDGISKMKTISLITATIGRPLLSRCIESVLNQNYQGVIEHFIVIDGKQWEDAALEIIKKYPNSDKRKIYSLTLPVPTKMWGGKIYAATPHITSGEFISNLDDDNFIDVNHFESLAKTIAQPHAQWAYSLRKITTDGKFMVRDNCDSLGLLQASSFTNSYHVDTNCYLLPRQIACKLSSYWATGTYFNDRNFLKALLSEFPKGVCSYEYSVNYEVPTDKLDMYFAGEQKMRKIYPKLPWERV
jgi:glycosyltransferase involved in cell wall biosynthesis